MYVDTSRDRFDPAKHFSAVLPQQGRTVLDSDLAEQNQILAHYLRTAIADIIGPAACPSGAPGFQLSSLATGKQPDLTISAGRIYVDGILVELGADSTYLTQPDGYIDSKLDALPEKGNFLVYLRVWERSVNALQDPDIREVALGIHGPDTAARSQVVWQLCARATTMSNAAAARKEWLGWEPGIFQPRGTLAAHAKQPADADLDICSISPSAQYRGRENQHYRTEIFSSGVASTPGAAAATNNAVAQFVWSRDNGTRAFAIDTLAGAEVTVASLGRDTASGLLVGDLVEIVDDASASRVADEVPTGHARALFQVKAIDALNYIVTLDRDPAAVIGTTGTNPAWHPLLRCWDGTGDITEGASDWIDLEDGVQVRFPGGDDANRPAQYRNGDYWLVPARTVLADVIWPQDAGGPQALPPTGIAYHYALLALVTIRQGVINLSETFDPIRH